MNSMPDTVVTCGHCVWHPKYGFATRVTAYIGCHGSASISADGRAEATNTQAQEAEHVALHWGFYSKPGSDGYPHDLAFIRLKAPFKDVTPLSWYPRTPTWNEKNRIYIAGYPMDKPKEGYDHGYYIRHTIDTWQGELFLISLCIIVKPLTLNLSGQSGSPLLVQISTGTDGGTQFSVVGVHRGWTARSPHGKEYCEAVNTAVPIGVAGNVFRKFLDALDIQSGKRQARAGEVTVDFHKVVRFPRLVYNLQLITLSI